MLPVLATACAIVSGGLGASVLRSIRCRPTPDLSRYEIVPIRSSSTDFALKVDGVIRGSRPDMPSLAAYVYGVLARR